MGSLGIKREAKTYLFTLILNSVVQDPKEPRKHFLLEGTAKRFIILEQPDRTSQSHHCVQWIFLLRMRLCP